MTPLYPNRKHIATSFVSNLQASNYGQNGNNHAVMENKIKEFRKKLGMSQEDVAKKAGTTRATIMKLETGQMNLTLTWMTKLATKVFHCTPQDLLDGGPASNGISDADVALMDSVMLCFSILIGRGFCDETYLDNALTYQYDRYSSQGLNDAMKVMQKLKEFVTGKSQLPEKQLFAQLLHMTHRGEA